MSWHHHRQQQQQAQPQQQQQQPNPYAQQVHQTTGLPPSVQAAYAAAAEAQDEAERFAAGLPIAHHGTHHHAELLLNYHQQQQAQEQRELRELQEQQYAQQQQQQQQAAAEEEEQQRQQQALLLQYQQQREGALSQPTASTWTEEAAAASAVAAAPTAASLVAAAREAAGYVPTADPLGRTGSREDEDADVHALIREMDGGHGVAAASAVAASASTPGTAVAKTRKRGPNKRRKALPKSAQQQKQQKQQQLPPALPPQAVQPPQAAPRVQPTPPIQEKVQRVPVQEPPKPPEQPRPAPTPAPAPPPAPAPYVQPLTPGGRARKRYDDALIDHSAAAREYSDAKKRLDEAQARFEAASTREVETSKALRHTVEECTPDLLKNDHGDFLSNRHSEKNEKRRKWNEMYHSLAAFHTLHGHCLVPRNDPDKNPDEKISPHMAKLGQWVFAQRAAYRKHRERQLKSDEAGADDGTNDEDGDGLEMYQRIALERLGFDFEPHANRWQSKYEELKAFCDEHGCGVVNLHPELKRQPEGSPERERLEALHRWVQMQTQLFRSLQKGKPSDGTGNLSQERIDMLTSLDPSIFDPKEAAWMDKYRQLRKFHDDHGHADVNPEMHGEQYAALYAWVNTQATQYRKLQKLGEEKANVKLTVERIKRLDELGMRWKERTPKQDKTWKKMYDKLKEYKEMYGHCYVPEDYPLNPELGQWVLDQRREYGKIKRSKSSRRSTSIMSMDRLQALDDLEFEWERGVDADDEELSRLRKQDGVRGDENAAKEDMDAIEWEDLDWDGYYSNLARLKEEYGDTFLSVLENENEHVGLWAEEQRRRYKEFNYPSLENETKAKKGKDGSGKKTPSKRKKMDEDDDVESEEQREKDSEDEDGAALWLERLDKLTKIGFMFDEDDVVSGVTLSPKMQRWNELFRDLLKNKMEEGTFFVPKKEPTLRCWAQELRREYVKAARGKKTNLTAEQIRRLDQVKSYSSWALWGKKYSSDVKTWNDRLTDLMVYRINHGSFDVDKELDEDLHDWVLMQQLTKAKKELDPRRAEKLRRIGLDFAKMERDRRKHEEKRRRQADEKKKKEKRDDERKKKAKREQEEKKKKAKQQVERKRRAARRDPEPVAQPPKMQKRGRGRPRKSEAKAEETSPAATATGATGNPPMPWGYGPMPRPMPGPVPWPYQGMMYGPSPQYYGMYNAVPPAQQPVRQSGEGQGSPTSSTRGRKRMVGSYLLRGAPPSGEQTAETPPRASSKEEKEGQTEDEEAKDNQEETAASNVDVVNVDSKTTDDSKQTEDRKEEEPNVTEASGESATSKDDTGGKEEEAAVAGDATEGTKPDASEVKAEEGESNEGAEQARKAEEGSSEEGAKTDKGKSDDVVFI